MHPLFLLPAGPRNLCEDLLFNNGAYAEYIRIPARIVEGNTYLVPEHVGYQDAALIEPLACVVRGWEETGPHAGDAVAVIGLGPIGLMFVKLAKLHGCRVIAVGRRKTQLDRAAALGADDLIVGEDGVDPVKTIRSMTGGRGVDIAIEAVGKPQTWQWAVNMVRRGGIVNFFGGCPNDTTVNTRYGPAALLRNHLQGQFPSHAGIHPQGAGPGFGRPHSGLVLRESRGTAVEPARSDAPPDEPQRPPEDGDPTVKCRAQGLPRFCRRPSSYRPPKRSAALGHSRKRAPTRAGWRRAITRISTW